MGFADEWESAELPLTTLPWEDTLLFDLNPYTVTQQGATHKGTGGSVPAAPTTPSYRQQ